MATRSAAMQVCLPCSATCDTMFRLQGTAAWATSTNLGSFLASYPWSHLTMLVTAWGDWWAFPVPLPVPLGVKVLPTNTPFSLGNPLGRPALGDNRPPQRLSKALLGLLYSPCSPDPQPPQGSSLLSKKTQQYVLSSSLFCFKPH